MTITSPPAQACSIGLATESNQRSPCTAPISSMVTPRNNRPPPIHQNKKRRPRHEHSFDPLHRALRASRKITNRRPNSPHPPTAQNNAHISPTKSKPNETITNIASSTSFFCTIHYISGLCRGWGWWLTEVDGRRGAFFWLGPCRGVMVVIAGSCDWRICFVPRFCLGLLVVGGLLGSILGFPIAPCRMRGGACGGILRLASCVFGRGCGICV